MAMRAEGLSIPRLHLITVEASQHRAFSLSLSPAVEQAIELACEKVTELLTERHTERLANGKRSREEAHAAAL